MNLSMKYKRILAFIAVIGLLLCDSDILTFISNADTGEESQAYAELTAYCGETLDISDYIFNEVAEDSELIWKWQLYSENDLIYDGQTDGAEKNKINLGELGVRAGRYEIRCAITGSASEDANPVVNKVIKLEVYKIPLRFDLDAWEVPGVDKAYDASDIFILDADMETITDAKDGLEFYKGKGIRFLIDAGSCSKDERAASDAGTYTVLKVKSIRLANSDYEDYFDFNDVDKLTGMVKGSRVSLTIKPRKLEFSKFPVKLEYRTGKLSVKSTYMDVKDKCFEVKINNVGDVDKIPVEDLNMELFRQLVDNLGSVTLASESKVCSFTCMDIDTDTNEGLLNVAGNIQFVFASECFETTGTKFLSYDIVNEDMRDLNVPGCLIFRNSKGNELICDKESPNSYYCDNSGVTVSYVGKGLSCFDSGAYTDIKYIDSKVSSLNVLEKKDIYSLYVTAFDKADKTDSIGLNNESEKYYMLMFVCNMGKSDEHATVAAIVHLVPIKEGCECPDNISGYPVITLFQDNTAPEVCFEGDELNRTDILIKNKQAEAINAVRNETVAFTVTDDESEITEVLYAFVDMPKNDGYNSGTHTYQLAGDTLDESQYIKLMIEPSGRYVVNVPDNIDTGDCVLYVKTKNKCQAECEYISNAMIIDKVLPVTKFTFTKQDGENVTMDVLNGKPVYSDQDVNVTIDLDEEHFDCAEVNVTKTDVKGNLIGDSEKFLFGETENFGKYKADITLCESGNYKLEVLAYDKAGNYSCGRSENPVPEIYYITVDKEKPCAGSIEVSGRFDEIKDEEDAKKGIVNTVEHFFKQTWSKFASGIKYNVFSRDLIVYVFTGEDEISPVDISYHISDKEMTEDELYNLKEEDWILWDEKKNGVIEAKAVAVIYERVTDKAGNSSYFNTEGMITDSIKPEVILSVSKPDRNDFYRGNVTFEAVIEDKVSACMGKASGLKYAAYRIEKEGKNVMSEILYDISDKKEAGTDSFSFSKNIYAKDFNSNDVVIYVTAVDNAGNTSVEKMPIKLDNVKPVISVSYNDKEGEKYYNQIRTATITIKERNLDTKDVKLVAKGKNGNKVKIGMWKDSGNAGKSDDATHVCQVVFSKDDEYEFLVECVDMAGNKAEKKFSDSFILDRTKPVISVTYEGKEPEKNGYYNDSVTAAITIKEHNFNAGKVDVRVNEGHGRTAILSEFTSVGDEHTATLSYVADGSYGLVVTYSDEANNAADSYIGNKFTIDMTVPEIEITDIVDKSANKGEVKPVITCRDENYAQDGVTITLHGANNGDIDLSDVGITSCMVNGGQQFTLDFPKEQMMDDLYTLLVNLKDRAGNEIEKRVEFSVNRFGSVYTLGVSTGEWLKKGICSYIQEGKPVVIIETNVDEVLERNISYSFGDVNVTVVSLDEKNNCDLEMERDGLYYDMKDNSLDGQWYQYEYTINENNFMKEGKYFVQIDSVDRAENHTSNVSNRHEDSDFIIEFAVDQTPPSAVITGAENGGLYNEDSHTVYIDVQDNMAVDCVTVLIDDREYGTYSKEDIEKFNDGLIPVKIDQSVSMQTIQITARDKAGNVLGKEADGRYDKIFDDFRILVTTNIFVRFLHSFWILIITAALGGGLIIIICRRRRIGKSA